MSSIRINQFFKTKMCPWFFKGRCERASACRFAHFEAELRNLPNLSRTSLCPNMMKGNPCDDQSRCRFAHTAAELRATDDLYKTSLCYLWMRGRCDASGLCRHAHGTAELRAVPSNKKTTEASQKGNGNGQNASSDEASPAARRRTSHMWELGCNTHLSDPNVSRKPSGHQLEECVMRSNSGSARLYQFVDPGQEAEKLTQYKFTSASDQGNLGGAVENLQNRQANNNFDWPRDSGYSSTSTALDHFVSLLDATHQTGPASATCAEPTTASVADSTVSSLLTTTSSSLQSLLTMQSNEPSIGSTAFSQDLSLGQYGGVVDAYIDSKAALQGTIVEGLDVALASQACCTPDDIISIDSPRDHFSTSGNVTSDKLRRVSSFNTPNTTAGTENLLDENSVSSLFHDSGLDFLKHYSTTIHKPLSKAKSCSSTGYRLNTAPANIGAPFVSYGKTEQRVTTPAARSTVSCDAIIRTLNRVSSAGDLSEPAVEPRQLPYDSFSELTWNPIQQSTVDWNDPLLQAYGQTALSAESPGDFEAINALSLLLAGTTIEDQDWVSQGYEVSDRCESIGNSHHTLNPIPDTEAGKQAWVEMLDEACGGAPHLYLNDGDMPSWLLPTGQELLDGDDSLSL